MAKAAAESKADTPAHYSHSKRVSFGPYVSPEYIGMELFAFTLSLLYIAISFVQWLIPDFIWDNKDSGIVIRKFCFWQFIFELVFFSTDGQPKFIKQCPLKKKKIFPFDMNLQVSIE